MAHNKPRLEMPNIEKMLIQEAKKEEKAKKQQELNPFGTGLKIVLNDGGVKTMQTSGSTAGAGSGEFHVYRAQRRTELTRLENMNREAQLDEINKEFQQRREQTKIAEADKAAKKAAKRKRLKEKQREKKRKQNANKNDNNDDDNEKNDNNSDDDDDNNDDEKSGSDDDKKNE